MPKGNDQKSDVHNSNNTDLSHNNNEYKSAQDNRSDQLNPNNDK